jgi:SpoVK/Ycf46/Vps4 family AAA+-type ATPase
MEQVRELLKARIQCIWIQSYEEAEVLKDLRKIVSEMTGMEFFVWSHTEGLTKQALTKYDVQDAPDAKYAQPKPLFDLIQLRQKEESAKVEGVFMLRDLHHLNENHAVNRALRDTKEYRQRNYNPIVVVSPVISIPAEHEKLFTVVEYDLPSKAEVRTLVEGMSSQIRNAVKSGKDYIEPTVEEKDKLVKACLGLTYNEIVDVFAKSLIKYNKLSTDAVLEEKIQLVKKSGVLDYSVPECSFDDIGGNHAYKDWIEEVQESFTEEARDFGVKLPKGALHVGVAGTSKTLMAEALASKMGVPLIKLQMSRIMDRLVGNSEKKIDQALRVVKAVAPCVLLIDEIEKALGGISSSSQTDGGTLARVFSSLLQFMHSNDNGVFVVMTSNDVSQLPPELTRSGRLDAHWYFTLPTTEERKEIFAIHLAKVGRSVSEDVLDRAVEETENYTGAEIEEIVKVTMRKAFARYRQDGNRDIVEEDILSATKEVIPLFSSSRENILWLDGWAKGRARKTNYEKVTTNFNASTDDDLLKAVLELKQ